MHESHVAAELVAAANQIALAEDATISRVRLRIGATSHILPETLQMHFSACASGSLAGAAVIVIEKDHVVGPDSDGVTLVSVTLEED